ncbi:quinone-dependent dihydroorotate dehydrogenase [Paenibacillus macerans]|uniref:quinone-dependent dihydroorotate dehydrogenase n=1 Tax=Paenibacillus macerans TaxID=44252 RepID=UPI0020404EB9|nr:quinone-dependent dihydroorotate dehydrogenase [Paenibacillus macerans]MCM3699826.1 quinone-dependent dihydroorotate dehydrogenase [Paenibacillus macerans]
MLYRLLGKPVFFRMDPENAHHLVINSLHNAAKIPGALTLMRGMYGVPEVPELATDLFGIHFPSPVGLAAGLDKNADAVEGFSAIGFGFMEVGTVTPVGQPGNDRPRLFRLPPEEALINRMGFNNRGAEEMAARLGVLKQRPIPVAVNIGKNKTTPNEEAFRDYEKCVSALYPYADFFVVNISSPNTPDLRNLQHGDELSALLQAVTNQMAAEAKKHGASKAVLVKIAPDVSDRELEYMVDTIEKSGVSGLIATNTTISREGIHHKNAKETGGLSGKPLAARSTEIVSRVYRQTGGRLPIIGSGGIFSAADAYDKIRAGASLVEIYTALIYEGPEINRKLHRGLRELLARDGFSHISEAVGADHR